MKLVSSAVRMDSSKTHLMTAVVKVRGKCQQTVRLFMDSGAQVSFVSADLVRRVHPKCVGQRKVELQSFGGRPTVTIASVYELCLVGVDGRARHIQALERGSLDLNIPMPTADVLDRWKHYGISLSEGLLIPDRDEVQILLGGDYLSHFLHEKVEVAAECAWRTDFGWVIRQGP